MKRICLIIALCCLYSSATKAQLSGMTPNQGFHNQTFQTTITSSGIFIQSSSPSGNLYNIQLTNGTDFITLFDWNNQWLYLGVTVVDPFTVLADITIPISVDTGSYTLEVTTGDIVNPWMNQSFYSLPGAFTVLDPDGYATGTVYNDLNKDGIKDAGEPGIANRTVKVLPTNFTVLTDANGDYSFPLSNGNYSLTILNQSNDIMFVTSANDTLPIVINNANAAGNDFGLKNALDTITPNNGYIGGSTAHLLVADEPIFIAGGPPNGNVSQVRVYSTPNIFVNVGTSVTVIDSFTLQLDINIPANVLVGINRDIEVYTNSGFVGSHFLRMQFNISAPPSSITGTAYHDTNLNGIKDAGEPGLQNRTVKLNPGNITTTTNVNGDYTFNTGNGSFDITILNQTGYYMFVTSPDDTISTTVNNSTSSGNDFGLKDALLSITPAIGYQGVATLHQLVASEPIFIPGGNPYGNVSNFVVYSSPGINVPVTTAVTVIDSFTVQAQINVPAIITVAGNIDIAVTTNSGFSGTHRLKQQFNVMTPPYFVSGITFFDQNQNKLYDPGEPKVSGAKLLLTPDSSYAFSNGAGIYMIGSFGGTQVLSYTNNVAGLQLFTDSVTYTMNVNSNITGKDFGFISTEPDYAAIVKDIYTLRRCNTQQYTSFRIRNKGNIAFNATAWLKFDPGMTYISSPITPALISNDTIYWNISNIQPYTDFEISALFLLPGAGSTINLTAGVASLDGNGVVQFTDDMTQSFAITCAWDPNDKQVTPPGIFPPNFTLMSDTLEYFIRFQNTGNDTAFNVVILDTLDSNLDYSTFEILSSSHSVQTELKNNGAVRFAFDNILLPDSNINEPESHGYILYRILAEAGLADSTPVYNTAHIFFDFNPDVVTNTTLNTMVYVLPVGIAESESAVGGVLFYPNPFSESASLYFDNPGSEKFALSVSDITGKKILPSGTTTGNSFVIRKNGLSKGMYFYKLVNTTTNKTYAGKFVVE